MKDKDGVSLGRLVKKLRKQFFTGILVVVPIGATILILVWLFTTVDNILQPVISTIFGRTIPGVGFGITIILIYLIGVVASNFLGKKLILYGEVALARVPLVSWLYASIKQIVQSFSTPGTGGLLQVVLIEFPRKGIRTIGFITNELIDSSGGKLLNIFIPTAPNPTSGFLQIAREEEVIRTDISVDDALKMVISAGKVTSQRISDKLSGEDQSIPA